MATGDSFADQNQQALSFILFNISRLPDDYMERIEEIKKTYIETFESCKRKPWLKAIPTGSSAEGLMLDEIEDSPGTFPAEEAEMEEADGDYMVVDCRFLVTERPNRDGSTYPLQLQLITGQGHHQGYCHLLADKQESINAVKQGILKAENKEYPSYMNEIDSNLFVSSSAYFSKALPYRAREVSEQVHFDRMYTHGPALTGEDQESMKIDIAMKNIDEEKTGEVEVFSSFDLVPSIELEHWPGVSINWKNRPRKWPSLQLVEEIATTKCHVVPVAHALSKDPDQEWRLSFSVPEMLLAKSLTIIQRQIYIFVKYRLWKNFINRKKILSSYHLKTTFFWTLEENNETFWKEENCTSLVYSILEKLKRYLLEHNLPNYFVPTNNMIDHVQQAQIEVLVNNIEVVQNDLIGCLLKFESENQPLILLGPILCDTFKAVLPFLRTDYAKLFGSLSSFDSEMEEEPGAKDDRQENDIEICNSNEEIFQHETTELTNFHGVEDTNDEELSSEGNVIAEGPLNKSFINAKKSSLLKLARLYQNTESMDFTVQILRKVWKQYDKADEMSLQEYITEMSLVGAAAEIDSIENIIVFHEYLLNNVFCDCAEIAVTLAYLNLCLAGVTDGQSEDEAIAIALKYLDSIEVDSLPVDLLKARILSKIGKYEEAQSITTKIIEILKGIDEINYIVVNPIEYAVIQDDLVSIIKTFALPCSAVTFVPINFFTIVLSAQCCSKMGKEDKIILLCEEMKRQMQWLDLDGADKQLGEDLLLYIQNLVK